MITLLSHWRAWMEAQGLSRRTIDERCATVRALLSMTHTTASTFAADDVIEYLRRDMAPASRTTYYSNLRAFTAWMVKTERRADDPLAKVPSPKRPKSLPRPVAPTLVEMMIRRARTKTGRAYVLLAAYAGLRVHEVAKIHGRDIDWFNDSIVVTGKGGKTARIPLHERLVVLAREMPRDDWWFPSPSRPGPVRAHAVSASIRRTMQTCGFDGKPHQLRHFYGTELVRAGVHLRVVQQLMRHESPATTAIYTQVDDEQLRAGIAALRPVERLAA